MDFQEQLMALLQTLLIGLLNIGAGYAVYLVKTYVAKLQAQSSKIKNEDQQQLVQSTLSRLEDLVKVTVVATEETVGKNLKELLKDGKIDKTEIIALSDQVKDEIYSQLSEDSKVVLNEQIQDVDLYISNLIEKVLAEVKTK